MGYEDLKIPSYNVPSAYDNFIVIFQGYSEPRKKLPPPAYIPPPVKRPPVANTGGDQYIQLPESFTILDGTLSYDIDGSISTWLWTQISGPANTLINSDTSTPTFIISVPGTFVYELKVTDNDGLTDTDQATITIIAANPVAGTGPDQIITSPVSSVTLNASSSIAGSGTIVNYLWTQLSGLTATIATPANISTNVTGLVTGSYVFRIHVTNSYGLTSTDTITITVQPGTPKAEAGPNRTITLPVSTVTVNAGASTPVSGTITTYLWTKLSGGSATITSPGSSSTSITGLTPGVYIFQVEVTNSFGLKSTDTMSVTAIAGIPIADAGINQTITLPTSTVTLNAVNSLPISGSIIAYLWSQLSGPVVTIVTPDTMSTFITGLSVGTFTFQVEVTNTYGIKDTDTVTITVNSAIPGNTPPVADAGLNRSITLPVSSLTVNASGSTDPDGTIISYLWTKVSGGAAVIGTPSNVSTLISGLVAGSYVFQIQVTDNSGGIGTDTMNVTVLAAANVPPVAEAGANQTITLPVSQVTLNASGSTDTDGTITAYLWSKVSGGSATIGSPSAISTLVTGLSIGTYVFQVQVTDNNGSSDVDTMTVTLNPTVITPPTGTYGVFGYGGMSLTSVVDLMSPFLRGYHLTFNWKDLEPTPGIFAYANFDGQMNAALTKGLKITFMSFTGYLAPEWLYSPPYNVPKVYPASPEEADKSYPYYPNTQYKTRWHNMLDTVKAHLKTLPAYANVLYMQDASGRTGDFTPWGGDTLIKVTINGVAVADPSVYEISDDGWDAFCQPEWLLQSSNIAANNPVMGFLMNPANEGDNWAWARDNIPNVNIKFGGLSHNYSIFGEIYIVSYIRQMQALGRYIRGEIDFPPIGETWWDTAPYKNTMALLTGMLHAGMGHFNISPNMYTSNAMDAPGSIPSFAYDFFNEFAGPWLPTQATKGFVYFRDVLDINDTIRFPESTYGTVVGPDPADITFYNNVVRAINASTRNAEEKLNAITSATVRYSNLDRRAALVAAFPGAIDGLNYLLNRIADQYNNDLGCDVVSGNWCKFITQYDQFNTSTPVWRVGGIKDFFGRYGMKIVGETFFSTTLVTGGPYTVTFTVYYLDIVATVVRMHYWNGTAKTQMHQIQTGNSGVFKYDQFTVTNFYGGGNLPNSNDFSMQQIGPNAITFGMVKIEIISASF